MARMMYSAKPPHGQTCDYARRGCTCYLWFKSHGKNTRARRRANRATEKHSWKREAARTC